MQELTKHDIEQIWIRWCFKKADMDISNQIIVGATTEIEEKEKRLNEDQD